MLHLSSSVLKMSACISCRLRTVKTKSCSVNLKKTTIEDVPTIFQLIKQLAEYEKLRHEVTATEDILRESLFGERPYAEAVIAYARKTKDHDLEPAGFSVFFYNFSTFTGKPGIYLENLFVRPEFRRVGIGKKLLIYLANLAQQQGNPRIEWVCLDWNDPSLEFYKSLGASSLKEWIIHRVEGKGLESLDQM
ncbi:acyl-CoA N-acyltransferase [Sporodiniella umbellata]|nr:acyl-CoA N-acyltransferase [Sporodiniella umbellata]